MFKLRNWETYRPKLNKLTLSISSHFEEVDQNDQLVQIYSVNLIDEDSTQIIFQKSFKSINTAIQFCNYRYFSFLPINKKSGCGH